MHETIPRVECSFRSVFAGYFVRVHFPDQDIRSVTNIDGGMNLRVSALFKSSFARKLSQFSSDSQRANKQCFRNLGSFETKRKPEMNFKIAILAALASMASMASAQLDTYGSGNRQAASSHKVSHASRHFSYPVTCMKHLHQYVKMAEALDRNILQA